MLRIDVSKIPTEGLDLQETLTGAQIRIEGGEDFSLQDGGLLRCHVEHRDEETVHVTGELLARLELVCGRCLDAFPLAIAHKLELFFLPHREEQDEDEVELTERDMVVAYYREHSIDLGEMVREQLFLAVPLKRLCGEGCQGLCPRCGRNRNRESCDCPKPEADSPLSSLGRLLGR
jgi:uncharacterized protein